MNSLLLSVLVLAQARAQPAESPSNSPVLREIGHTKTSAACGFLRDTVRPAIAGVLKNDEAINVGQSLLEKTRDDSTPAARGAIIVDLGMDHARLGRVTVVLAHNLKIIRALLNRMPKPGSLANHEDTAARASIEANLRDVVRNAKRDSQPTEWRT